MSRSELFEFNKCPSRWISGYRDGGTKSTSWGTLVDCLLLDDKRFAERFAVKPATYIHEDRTEREWNGNSKVCKQWMADHDGKEIVSSADVQSCKQSIAILKKDAIVLEMLENSHFQTFVSAQYKDKDTGLSIPIKCLLDIEPKSGRSLADFKTGQSADHRPFAKSVSSYAYHWQAAMYLDAYNSATGELRDEFKHIIQESFEPFEIGKRLMSLELVDLGRNQYLMALKRYCQCLTANHWPGYDDLNTLGGWSLVQPEKWMVES